MSVLIPRSLLARFARRTVEVPTMDDRFLPDYENYVPHGTLSVGPLTAGSSDSTDTDTNNPDKWCLIVVEYSMAGTGKGWATLTLDPNGAALVLDYYEGNAANGVLKGLIPPGGEYRLSLGTYANCTASISLVTEYPSL